MRYSKYSGRGNFFSLPNEVFLLGLSAGELAVYSFLKRCENRKTHQCWPSIRTIGEAVRMSENTVRKYIRQLEERGLITTEPTEVITKTGEKRNGNLHPHHRGYAEAGGGNRGRLPDRLLRRGDGPVAKRRKHGDGSVRLRKDGRWEGRVVIGYDEKGLPKTKNVLAKTKTECVAKLKALRERLETPAPEVPKAGLSLGAWLDHWYQDYKKASLRPNTQMSYERRIYQHIIPALGGIQLDKLTTGDIQQFYTHLRQNGRLLRTELYGEGLSDQTIRGIHTTLHAALDKAVEEKLIFRNPADSCKLPPVKGREMKVLTPEEIQRLLIQAREDGCYELLLLELATGLRRGKILALQWRDLNLRTGALRVERQVHRVKGELAVSPPKTKAGNRTVLLPAPVLNVLKTYKQAVHSRWMFPSPVKEDSPMDPAAVRKRLQTVLERAECKRLRFHDLRHTFATASLEHGMDIKTLSTIIGHVSSTTTLNTYTHVTDAMRQNAADKIDQGIGRAEPKPRQEAAPQKPAPSTFQAHKGQRRKPGTGCVSQINDHLWEGRYSPIFNGQRMARNVYAKTEAECEKKLAELIWEMKAEIAAGKEQAKQQKPAS